MHGDAHRPLSMRDRRMAELNSELPNHSVGGMILSPKLDCFRIADQPLRIVTSYPPGGFPSTSTRSACLPTSMEPVSMSTLRTRGRCHQRELHLIGSGDSRSMLWLGSRSANDR